MLNTLLTGAGQHAELLKQKYEELCKEACKKSIACLKSGGSALDAVVEATVVLEDSPLTNAGYGSNLTNEGNVECDASVMDGSNLHFGAIGAADGIRNPINVAKELCLQQSVKRACGLIQPSLLVGNGVQTWAKSMGLEVVSPKCLISENAAKTFKRCKRKLENIRFEDTKSLKKRLDTVGAVCVDEFGNIASACSSGGIILKHSGRVGQAGVWGCGVWASNWPNAVGITTSGCGEHIIRTNLARAAAEAIAECECPTTKLHEFMKSDFIESRFLSELEQKLAGLIAIRYSPEDKWGDVLWCHSTKTMIIGYMNSYEKSAVSHSSQLDTSKVGKHVIVGGTGFKFSKNEGEHTK